MRAAKREAASIMQHQTFATILLLKRQLQQTNINISKSTSSTLPNDIKLLLSSLHEPQKEYVGALGGVLLPQTLWAYCANDKQI